MEIKIHKFGTSVTFSNNEGDVCFLFLGFGRDSFINSFEFVIAAKNIQIRDINSIMKYRMVLDAICHEVENIFQTYEGKTILEFEDAEMPNTMEVVFDLTDLKYILKTV